MFAGAVREAVFSRPEVIRKVKEEFVSVAVRAQHVQGLHSGAEGRLFSDISKSRLVPQGLAVLNGDGQVLEWVLMFDGTDQIGKFLDHASERYRAHPDGKEAVTTERHMRYPSQSMPSLTQPASVGHPADGHEQGEPCPGDNRPADGSARIDLVGRTVTPAGAFSSDTLTQDNYVQDQFDIDARLQRLIWDSLGSEGGDRFELPKELSRAVQAHAYLGQVDACPVSNPLGGSTEIDRAELFGSVVRQDEDGTLVRIEGETEAAGSLRRGNQRVYDHSVKLGWHGYMLMKGGKIARLALVGKGTERFQWFQGGPASDDAVQHLPAGHRVDVEGAVQYGLVLRAEKGG